MRSRRLARRLEGSLNSLSKVLAKLPGPTKKWLLERTRHRTGLIGLGLRLILAQASGADLGRNVSFREGIYLLAPRGLQTGSNVSFHPMCYIDATGGIVVGDNVSIAHGVTIMSTSHTHRRHDLPIKYQPVELMRTVIGDDCWIGAQSLILAGVTIGHGCVVAANSVVNRDIPPNTVVAGSPAKIVKERL